MGGNGFFTGEILQWGIFSRSDFILRGDWRDFQEQSSIEGEFPTGFEKPYKLKSFSIENMLKIIAQIKSSPQVFLLKVRSNINI